MNNSRKRNLMIALNEAFEMGKTMGIAQESLRDGLGEEWVQNEGRKTLERLQRLRLDWLVGCWEHILEEDDDE